MDSLELRQVLKKLAIRFVGALIAISALCLAWAPETIGGGLLMGCIFFIPAMIAQLVVRWKTRKTLAAEIAFISVPAAFVLACAPSALGYGPSEATAPSRAFILLIVIALCGAYLGVAIASFTTKQRANR